MGMKFLVCVCVVWILNILRKPTRRYNQVYVYKERVEYFCASVCMDVRTYGELFALVWFCATTMTMAKAVMTISVKRLACKRMYVFLHNVVYIYIFTMVGARLPSQLFVDLKIKSWLWPKF